MNTNSATTIVLKKPGRQALLSGHPWLRTDSLVANSEAADGSVVELVDQEGTWLGRGIYNSKSHIKVRVYSRNQRLPIDQDFWQQRVTKAIELRKRLGMLDPKNACRLVFSESDLLSGVIIDQYATSVVISLTAKATVMHKEQLIAAVKQALSDFPLERLIVRTDQNMLNTEGMELVDEVALGDLPADPIVIQENNLQFHVDLSDGQKTGFYLDQQENRKLFGTLAKGRVLDVCCYSGGFALSAAKGGCTNVTAVDSSLPVLQIAEKNAQKNGLNVDFVKADCFEYLTHLKEAGEKFDSIVLDPPKFAGRRNDVPSALRAYHRLNRSAMDLLNENGLLFTCSCSGRVSMDEFRRAVLGASRRSGCDVQMLYQNGASPDHPVLMSCPETQYLKCIVAVVN